MSLLERGWSGGALGSLDVMLPAGSGVPLIVSGVPMDGGGGEERGEDWSDIVIVLFVT